MVTPLSYAARLRRFAIRRPRSATVGATANAVVGNVLFHTERGFLKRDRHAQSNILTLHRTVPALSAAAKRAAKHSAQNIAKVKILKAAKATEASKALTAAHGRIERGVPKLIVFCTLVRIGKHGVSLVRLLKLFLCYLVAGIGVRVVFFCKLIVCLFNGSGIGTLVNAQNLVVISLICHPIGSPSFSIYAVTGKGMVPFPVF